MKHSAAYVWIFMIWYPWLRNGVYPWNRSYLKLTWGQLRNATVGSGDHCSLIVPWPNVALKEVKWRKCSGAEIEVMLLMKRTRLPFCLRNSGIAVSLWTDIQQIKAVISSLVADPSLPNTTNISSALPCFWVCTKQGLHKGGKYYYYYFTLDLKVHISFNIIFDYVWDPVWVAVNRW